jgi:hypothetical protein
MAHRPLPGRDLCNAFPRLPALPLKEVPGPPFFQTVQGRGHPHQDDLLQAPQGSE